MIKQKFKFGFFPLLVLIALSCSVSKNGLVGYYTFDKGKAIDYSGKNNTGTIRGAISTSDRFQKTNESCRFKNENDYISVNSPSFINDNQGTFVAWVKFNSLDHIQYVASVCDTNSIENYLSFIRTDNSTKTIGIYQREPNLANWVNGTTAIEPDTYYNIAMVSNGLTWSIFINGKKEELIAKKGKNTGKWIGSLFSIDNFVIGSSIIKKPYTIPYLDGCIDKILLFNRPLSEKEINRIYRRNKRKENWP